MKADVPQRQDSSSTASMPLGIRKAESSMAHSGKKDTNARAHDSRSGQPDVQVDFPGKKSVRSAGGWE
jgi:hypothetical protein